MEKYVIKRFGDMEKFDSSKIENSLKSLGLDMQKLKTISNEIKDEAQEKTPTKVIYNKVLEKLKDVDAKYAMKYSVRRALFDLGPTGFPFEKFIAKLYERMGYESTRSVMLKGFCVEHEVDVFTTYPERIAMEVKFHNDLSIRSDLKTVLYVKSRFDDLMKTKKMFAAGIVDRCLLVTNTKFTSHAIVYAKCANLPVMSWNYPKDQNLKTLINQTSIHPITCLLSLSKKNSIRLFDNNIITCNDFINNVDFVKNLGIDNINVLIKEAKSICS